MASLSELADQHTELAPRHVAHLQRLVRSWDLLADLSFADLLLFGRTRDREWRFVVLDQIRPTTGPTMYRHDRIGEIVEGGHGRGALLTEAARTGRVVDGGLLFRKEAPRIRALDIPVRLDGELIAVVSRQFVPDMQRPPGDLEIAYFTVCRRLDRMVAEGTFPFPPHPGDDEMPRVGDGVLIVDADRRVGFVSPNARSILVRLGFTGEVHGRTLDDELGLPVSGLEASLAGGVPVADEVEQGDITAWVHCLPLVAAGVPTGALVLLRDVSDLRHRDRLLDSKDAAITEIHHRVKNNLQTVSALLRLQGRRLTEPAAKQAIDEAVRRIRSIAVVHEILAHEPSEATSFAEILRTLVRLVEEGLVDPVRPVEFRVEGDAGELRSAQSTQLAVVLTELLQNAVEHAFAAPGIGRGLVSVTLANDGQRIKVTVDDDGIGTALAASSPVPTDTTSTGLGLTLVRTLVESELGGTVEYRTAGGPPDRPGTRVEIEFPC